MAYQSPPAEARQCSQCSRVLSLNFFALDDAERAAIQDL